MALAASLLDGTALKWTSMLFLMSSLIGGLLEGSSYSQTYQLADVLDTSTSILSYYQLAYSVTTLLGFYCTFRYFLFPNTIAAIFSVGCGVMFILMPIILAAETEEEMFMSAGNITMLIIYYGAFGLANGVMYMLCPMFLRKLHRADVNLASGYLAYSGSFQAVGISLVAGTDSILSIFVPNITNLLVCMLLIGFAFIAYAYVLHEDSELCEELLLESYALKKLASRNRRAAAGAGASVQSESECESERGAQAGGSSALGAQAEAGAAGVDTQLAGETGVSLNSSEPSFQTMHPVPETGLKVQHYHVEYILFVAEVFRGGSVATTFTYMYEFLDESDYENFDSDDYEVMYGTAIALWLAGKLLAPIFQDLYGTRANIYAANVALNVISVLVFIPFMVSESLQTMGVYMSSMAIYAFVNGPSYSLMLDLNNRLTYETSQSSIILIMANIAGFVYPNIICAIYNVQASTNIFLVNIVICACVAGFLSAIAPLFSYVPKTSEPLLSRERSSAAERQPIMSYT